MLSAALVMIAISLAAFLVLKRTRSSDQERFGGADRIIAVLPFKPLHRRQPR